MTAIPVSPFPVRSPAVWLVALIVAMMVFNAWQAFAAPTAFVARFGTPGAADANSAFVTVYASRALFLALVPAVLLGLRQFAALGWFAAVAVIMPIADAAQVSAAGGSASIVARHLAIAAYLAVTALLLLRLARKTAP